MNGRCPWLCRVAAPAGAGRIPSVAGIGGEGQGGGDIESGGRGRVAMPGAPHRSRKNASSNSQFARARGRPPPLVLGIPRCLGWEEVVRGQQT